MKFKIIVVLSKSISPTWTFQNFNLNDCVISNVKQISKKTCTPILRNKSEIQMYISNIIVLHEIHTFMPLCLATCDEIGNDLHKALELKEIKLQQQALRFFSKSAYQISVDLAACKPVIK